MTYDPSPSQTKECPNCGFVNSASANFCSSCSSPLQSQQAGYVPPPATTPMQGPPGGYVPPPVSVAPVQSPYGYAPQVASKDRSTATILEVLPGLFGFLGFGWIYAGNTSTGIALLIGFFVWSVIAGIISVLTAGIGAICWLPISIGCIVFSTIRLNAYTKQHPELFGF
jgi:hypothetical protein